MGKGREVKPGRGKEPEKRLEIKLTPNQVLEFLVMSDIMQWIKKRGQGQSHKPIPISVIASSFAKHKVPRKFYDSSLDYLVDNGYLTPANEEKDQFTVLKQPNTSIIPGFNPPMA